MPTRTKREWSPSVRQSLIAVALLGVVTCVVSIVGIWRLIANANAQRVERGHDLIAQQLEVIRKMDETATPSRAPVRTPMLFGMQGGVLPPGTVDAPPDIEAEPARVLSTALHQSTASHAPVVLDEASEGETTILAGAGPTAHGGMAWAVHRLVLPEWVARWRMVGNTLGFLGIALVLASVHLALSVQRGASALKASLAALQTDLTADVQRPALRELSEVADGIAALGAELARGQEERTRLGAELAERERLAALGRVAAGVAHEVRNPLASIKLRLDLARLEAGGSAALEQELTSASEEIARLDRFVADLLTVAGRRTGPRVPGDLGALARRRVELAEPWSREHGVVIHVHGSAVAPVDGDAVGRVIDNLIRNAVEASPPGGAVTVTVAERSGGATLVVSDQGPGVPTHRNHELFEPFFTTKPDGTGLGLALSHAIATAHGGTLEYERRGGRTDFELSLPSTLSPETKWAER